MVLGGAGRFPRTSPDRGRYYGLFGSAGVNVPAGALDVWRAARASHATQLVEAAYFGDSTGYGSGGDGGPVREIRDQLLAAGFTDGGRGVASKNETASSSGENLAPLVSATGAFANTGNAYDFLITDSPGHSTTAGDEITMQGKGTAVRIYYGIWPNNTGSFTYSINGGAAVTVDASTIPPGGPTFHSTGVVEVTGLAEGTHTVKATTVDNARGIVVEFFRPRGLVFHKQAVSGISMGTFFDATKSQSTSYPNVNAQRALGLEPGLGSNGYDWGAEPATVGRDVKVAFLALGINDMGAGVGQAQVLYDGAVVFVRMSRAAGADPVVVVPHFKRAANGTTAVVTAFRDALFDAATDEMAAWADLDWALDQGGYPISGGSHLSQTGYDIEGQFLWDSLLSV